MIVKQKNLRVFHIIIEREEEFLEYFQKNSVILKEFFLLLEGNISDKIANLLEQSGVCFKVINGCNLKLGGVKKEVLLEEKKDVEKETLFTEKKVQEEKKKNLAVFDRPIRSGEEINEDIPVMIFGRVNSGAKLFCNSSVTIYGEIDGLVQCDGEYVVLLGISSRGHLIFNGEIIDRTMIKENVLQKVLFKNNKIVVKEVF
jgi:septum site-determining protein MinC